MPPHGQKNQWLTGKIQKLFWPIEVYQKLNISKYIYLKDRLIKVCSRFKIIKS